MNFRSSSEQQLWMNLSSRQRVNVLTLLPKMMRELLEKLERQPQDEEEAVITFPSDYEWRSKIYVKLLAKQKEEIEARKLRAEEALTSGAQDERMEDELLLDPSPKLHDWKIVPSKNKKPAFCAPDAARLAKHSAIGGPGPITWTVSDIAKAGCLLCTPPIETKFTDEQEMRRIYTLIYDVYRYKNVLGQALTDVGFFVAHRDLVPCTSRVWLLLYDLYHRSFKKRSSKNASVAGTLFPSSGLQEPEEELWVERVKLAAAVARLRIQHSVLKLSQLLPHHLRDDKFSAQHQAPVTCWINIRKVKNREDLCAAMKKVLEVTLVEEGGALETNGFKWDPHCPQFLIFHPSARTKLAQSNLVQKHKLIVQDRSFCLGPATFGKIISDLQLTGTVIQSHVNSPRTTAYLASLLSQNDNIKKLLAFSAGSKKKEYESYFNDLGIKNILIFSEKLIDLPPDSSSLEEVIAVFATPPNSYSAVSDPIDLVCSRGGDLSILEVLTETEDTPEGRNRVALILDEQKRTLKFAMSRPQIQFVLYETHSEIEAENEQMVRKSVTEMNKCARLHHATIQGKLKLVQEEELTENEINNNLFKPKPVEVPKNEKKSHNEIVVPDCDVFDVPTLPVLCPSEACILSKEGCYLALLQRKQVTKMDNKYMIQMAETRGLFGDLNKKPNTKKTTTKKTDRAQSPPVKMRRRNKEIEIDRISAATNSSLRHARRPPPSDHLECDKAKEHQKVPQTRRWWTETTRHLTNLRASLSNRKLLPSVGDGGGRQTAASTGHLERRGLQMVDEIAAKAANRPGKIPVYPKLRLTRCQNKFARKVPVPVHITMKEPMSLAERIESSFRKMRDAKKAQLELIIPIEPATINIPAEQGVIPRAKHLPRIAAKMDE